MRKLLFIVFVLIGCTAWAQNHAVNLKKLEKIQEAGKSIVLLNNSSGMVPLMSLDKLNIASVHINFDHAQVFDSLANKYWRVIGFNGDTIKSEYGFNVIHDKLKLYNLVIVELSAATANNSSVVNFIKDLESTRKVLVVLTGSGNYLSHLNDVSSPVIWYKNNDTAGASVAAQLIFGGLGVSNKLTDSFGKKYSKGSGYITTKIRLGYSLPESVAINSDNLTKIDSIANAGIAAHATPACVILLAKDGQVIFSKAYGKHTYTGNDSTRLSDIFDMASVTKVTATTPAIMHLYETRAISLDSPISKYVAALRNIPDKRDIKIKEALLHEAGFTPYIKFFQGLKPGDMNTDSSAAYPTKVADHYYLRANYFTEVMWPITLASKVETRGKFVYSDLSMYMMKEVFENASHEKLNDFVLNYLYLPLGMQSTGYLPRNRFDKSRIVPTTENDNWFRNMLVQGYVNDPGSAMAGGVEGHAGLFANANDLGIYYQMLLNKGTYGGHKYFDSTTVKTFTKRESVTTQRGYGFDRVGKREANDLRSDEAFGHSGYTGTFVWVDPKYNLVYICLTNRVYPDDGKTYPGPKINIRALTLAAYYNAIVNK